MRSERGASAIEFALIFPLLALILFGIIDFGLAFFTQMQVTSVAREGARAAVVLPPSAAAQMTTRALAAAPGMTSLAVSIQTCSAGAVTPATAAATQTHQWIFLGPLVGNRPIKASAVMQCGG